jgi:hypothetical protein
MKETCVWAKSVYSCLLIQSNLIFCLRLDSWSRSESTDHTSRKPSICLNFSSLNKSRYGSTSVSNSTPIAWKAPHMLDSTSVCLKSWYTFIMNLTIFFRLRTAICIPDTVWEHQRGSHQELERFELYVMQKLWRALVLRWEDRWDHQWHEMTWLGQLSINNTPVSSANPSNVRSSARLGKKTVRM